MKIKICPNCEQKLIAKLTVCTRCGASVEQTEPAQRHPTSKKIIGHAHDENLEKDQSFWTVLFGRPRSEAEDDNEAAQPAATQKKRRQKPSRMAKLLFWTSPIWFVFGLFAVLTIWLQINEEERRIEQEQKTAAAEEKAAVRAKRQAERELEKEKCRQRPECWAESNMLRAALHCEPMIEKLAKYDHQWTDGWTDTKFSRFRLKDSSDVFVYAGDKIEFKNGIGNWIPHRYTCTFDVSSSLVLGVTAEPGNLR